MQKSFDLLNNMFEQLPVEQFEVRVFLVELLNRKLLKHVPVYPMRFYILMVNLNLERNRMY